jgi:hypothetical protein
VKYPPGDQFFYLSVVILELSCMIGYALKELMAIAAMESPIVINCFGQPGIEISVICGSAFMMSLKSSMKAPIIIKLTSVVDLAIELKVSLCFSSYCS